MLPLHHDPVTITSFQVVRFSRDDILITSNPGGHCRVYRDSGPIPTVSRCNSARLKALANKKARRLMPGLESPQGMKGRHQQR